MEGIREYYRGINVTFERINQEIPKDMIFPIVEIKEAEEEEEEAEEAEEAEEKKGHRAVADSSVAHKRSFESIVGEIMFKPIKVLSYSSSANSFRVGPRTTYYSDCVETTARNLINLLLYDGVKFNIDDLVKMKGEINERTIEYYRTFDSYDLQLSTGKKQIYGQLLTAIDAWSYLIIHHANTNISFKRHDTYEVYSGVMSKDGTKTNFIQLLQNLLSPRIINPRTITTDLPKLNSLINSVQSLSDGDPFQNGAGTILIDYEIYYITFYFRIGHSFITIRDKVAKINTFEKGSKQYEYIDFLLANTGSITSKNYLWFKYTTDLLEELYNKVFITKDSDFVFKLLEMSMSDLSNSDSRNRIVIDVDFLKDHLKNINSNKYVNQFNYTGDDFKFLDEMPNLTKPIYIFKNNSITELPDLTPLIRLTSLWDSFAYDCNSLTKIDLSELVNLVNIGISFASNCTNLNTIKLINLPKLERIDSLFAAHCPNLKTVELNNLPKLKALDDSFAANCPNLKTIELINLPEVGLISADFAFECPQLETIKIIDLPMLDLIVDPFHKSVKTLVMSGGFPKLKSFVHDTLKVFLINPPEIKESQEFESEEQKEQENVDEQHYYDERDFFDE